jgi:amino acid transporter/nucleotide-binding universal stress UspA family protein
MGEPSTDAEVGTELSRNLGLLEITMIGIGAMIGAGVFALTGFAAGIAGPALLLAFLVNGIIALLTAMSYAELGAAFPQAGGAYNWVTEALPSPYGFYTGWVNWLTQALACALYAVTFGSFLITLITAYSGLSEEFVLFGFLTPIIAEKAVAMIVIALFAYINYRGAEEAGGAEVLVVVLKLIILGLFIVFGILATFSTPDWPSKFLSSPSFFPTGIPGILGAMGFTYVAFEGYDIIVQSGEEVKNPGENIPKSIFYALLATIPIYILVGFAAIGGVTVTQRLLDLANIAVPPSTVPTWKLLGNLGELGIIRAASQFVPYGFLLLIIAGLAATVSALNATLFASSRIAFSMSRDRLLPPGLSEISERTRSPSQAIFFSAVLIAVMAVALPIESVASATSVMFLLLFSMVNVAAIVMRRDQPDIDRPFSLPYMPTIPLLGIVFQLLLLPFLLVQQGLAPGFGSQSQGFIALVTVVVWFAFGALVYTTYSSEKEEEMLEEETPTVVTERPTKSRESQLVVPIANPENAGQLMRTAIDVARARNAEIHVISVVTVAPQTPLDHGRQYVDERREILGQAISVADEADVPVKGTVRIGHDAVNAILNTIEQEDAEAVLVGWRGQQRRRRDVVLGDKIDRIVTDARCDVLVERMGGTGDIESILLPTAGGPHAEYAAEVAGAIARANNARVELVYVLGADADEDAREDAEELFTSAVEAVGEHEKIDQQLLNGDDIVATIVEQTGDHDLTIVGATREGLLQQVVFGAIPEEIAQRAESTVIMAKRNLPLISVFSRWLRSHRP